MFDPALLQLAQVLALAIGVPVARARWRGGAGWMQIGCALATWALILLTLFLAAWGDDPLHEAIKIVAVFAIFFGWMMVPLIAVFYQVTNTPGWAITIWQQRARA